MCSRKCGRTARAFSVGYWRVFFFSSLFLFLGLLPVFQVHSEQPSPIWLQLKTQIDSLPNQFRLYNQSLLDRVTSLNSKLTQSQLSVTELMRQNKDLTSSLTLSRSEVATWKQKSEQLQKDLTASTQSIIRAQHQAKVLEAQNRLLKIGLFSAAAVIVGVGGYALGHYALHWW